MKAFDKARPHQEIFGNDPGIPYRYIQGGRFFDDAGNEVSEDEIAEAQEAALIANQSAEAKEARVAAERKRIEAKVRAEVEAETKAKIDAAVQEAVAKALAAATVPQPEAGNVLKEIAGGEGVQVDNSGKVVNGGTPPPEPTKKAKGGK